MRERLGIVGGGRRPGARRPPFAVGVAVTALVGIGGLAACEVEPVNTVIVVTTTLDGSDLVPGDGTCEVTAGEGDCSLRAAVDEANATTGLPPMIELPPGTYGLTRFGDDDTNGGGDLDLAPVSGEVVLAAQQPGTVVLDAAGSTGALDVRSGRLTAFGLAVRGAAGPGLAVRAGAEATVGFAALHDNIGHGVTVAAGGSARLLHTTVSENDEEGVANDGALTLQYVTLASNFGGGIAGSGTTTVESSVVAGQVAGPACDAPLTSLGWNLDGDGSCGLDAAGDAGDTDPAIQPLSDDLVPFHRAIHGSAVLDAVPVGSGGCVTGGVDQRLAVRPQGPSCDRGAVEAPPPAPYRVDTAADASDAAPGDGVCATAAGGCTLRAAVDEANAGTGAAVVTIAAGIDPVLALPGGGEDSNRTGDLDVLGDLVVVGNGATIDGGGLDRVLDLHGAQLALRDLTVTGGRATVAGSAITASGGGVQAGGRLDLAGVTVTGNEALDGGGGVATVMSGEVRMTDTTVSANTSGGPGGGVSGVAEVVRSRITANSGSTGGGLHAWGGFMESSTVDGNHAEYGGGGLDVSGGGYYFVTNSTVSGNHATTGSGINAAGPLTVTVWLDASTVTGNTGSPGLVTTGQYCRVGGCTTFATMDVAHSIVAGAPGFPACTAPVEGAVANLAPDGSCGGTLPGEASLGGLADNGGPTPTHLPGPGSGAIDALAPGAPGCDGTVAPDQRGVPRPQGEGCDVGAVEQ